MEVEEVSLSSPALEQLYNGQEDLIGIISDLAEYGMHISVPCFVVVGDRCSGKSSVLEAITGLRFAVHGETGTKFPVELHLSPNLYGQEVTIRVRIQLSDASEQEYEVDKSLFDENGISAIIDAAEEKILEGGARFSEDVLIIDIHGPGVPHLSLVDLPGFYPPQNDNDSTTDREILDRLVERYMTKCLVLAVVSAQHPQNRVTSQRVLSEVKRHDKDNTRTLGVITKPDLLMSGIKDEKDFLSFAKDVDQSVHTLAWGWHLLCNRSSTEVSDINEERDEKEESFFQSNYWSNVVPRNLGAPALRAKLNSIILDYSNRDAHRLSKACKEAIIECKNRLELLGEPRSTATELRAHLEKLALRFHTLCLHAIEGNYDDEFFGGLFPGHEAGWFEDNRIRKLQALLRDQNRAFVHVLNTKGSKRIILPKGSNVPQPKTSPPLFLQELVNRYDFDEPAKLTFEDVTAHLQLLLPAYQGREFSGTSNDALVVKLFREQSQPWEAIARRHIQLMLSMTEEFVKKLVHYITKPDLNTCSRIISKIVEPFFDLKSTVLESKLQELLYHYKTGHLQVLDTEFQARLALRRQNNGNMGQIRDLFAKQPEIFTQEMRKQLEEMGQFEGSSQSVIDELVDKSEICYEMSLRTFTDNVVVLAVENCLIRDLPQILTVEKFKRMTDDELEQLASEAADIQETRQQQQVELEFLKEALQACHKWKMKREYIFARRLFYTNAQAQAMPSMYFEIGDLLGTAYRSEDNVPTVLDDKSVTPTISTIPTIQESGNTSGIASASSAQTDQQGNPAVVPEASTLPTPPEMSTKITAPGTSMSASQQGIHSSPLPPTPSYPTAPLVKIPITCDSDNVDLCGDFVNICVHTPYSNYSPEELRVYALSQSSTAKLPAHT
ncbi:hypothetical protein Hte_005105 [Hypoxylon texense]